MRDSREAATNFWRRTGWVLLVGALAVVVGFWARRTLAPEASGEISPTAVGREEGANQSLEFALDTLDAERVTAQDFSGRVLVVDFWATWCGPCRLQEEILRALHERYKSRPVSFVAINVGESEELVRDFVDSDPFAYPVLMDPAQSLSAKYGIYALPTVMVLDREQRILYQNMGVSSGLQIGAVIERALGAL